MKKNNSNSSYLTTLKQGFNEIFSVLLKENKAKALAENRELKNLRFAFEQAPCAVFIIDKNFRFVYINPYFTQMSGYTKDDVLDKRVIDILYKGKFHETPFEVNEKLLNGEKWQRELLTYNKNGSTYWANTIAAPYKDEAGNTDGYIIIQQDITEKRQMQVSLQESEKFYRTLIESSMDAVSLNQNGRFLLVNSTFCNMFGYTNEEIMNLVPEEFIVPEDRERVMDYRYKRMQGDVDKQNYTASFLHKSGKRILTELNATTVQVNGQNASFITMSDITERTEMETALRKSEQKYRELADFLPQTVYELDNRGNLLYMNKSGMVAFGITDADFGGSALDSFIPEDRERMIENLKMTANGKRATPMNEYTAVHRDGTTFPVMIYGVPMYQDGISIGTRGMIVDISDRKTMENALRESESKYKTLIENSQDGIFAIIEDKILFANNTFCNMLGYIPEELYDKSAASLVFPEDRVRGLTISERRRLGDHSTVNEIFRFIAKNGSLKEADVFSSVLELNGQIVSYITVHDLTVTRLMQKQLESSEEKYRTVIEKATDGIVITQLGKLMFVNNTLCEMLQYTENELVGMTFINLVVEKDKQQMVDFHKRRMTGEDFTALYRSRIIRKDGKIVTVELNARTSNYNGNPAAFIIIRDISDRIQIENELQAAKSKLEKLNNQLEKRVKESSERLTEARTQLINLQKENLQSQFDVLKQQVNPHFLFNSLNVLTSLIKLEPDLAEKFSEQLSKVYRYVLENKDNELVDLNTELNFLDAYIFLLNIRFVDKLKVNINIPEARRNDQIIPLAMQLLIENAIKHNIMSKSEPLAIDIFIDADNFLNIVNNLQERPSQLVSTGVGLKNIQNRYLLLNNTEPVFEKTNTHFIAKVPLVILE
jgi:PAS domain S-box-containing protein